MNTTFANDNFLEITGAYEADTGRGDDVIFDSWFDDIGVNGAYGTERRSA